MQKKIENTAFVYAVSGQSKSLKSAIIELVEQTLKEPGCEIFKVFQCDEDPEQFILWEVFSDELALQDHLSKDYTKKYFALGLALSTTVISHSELNNCQL